MIELSTKPSEVVESEKSFEISIKCRVREKKELPKIMPRVTRVSNPNTIFIGGAIVAAARKQWMRNCYCVCICMYMLCLYIWKFEAKSGMCVYIRPQNSKSLHFLSDSGMSHQSYLSILCTRSKGLRLVVLYFQAQGKKMYPRVISLENEIN